MFSFYVLHFFMVAVKDFAAALERHQSDFGLSLTEQNIVRLTDFYELVKTWNKRLHLVAPCPAEEFAVRHVLESLVLLEYLPENAGFADVGTGAGLPSIPCLIVREDLRGTLIESSQKKAIFLREATAKLELQPQVLVMNLRFEQMPPPEKGFVTSRALDKFTEKLPEIVEWAREAEKLLFFGGDAVRDELKRLGLHFTEKLIPQSEQRFIFAVGKSQ